MHILFLVEECERRWNNIRHRFAKERRLIKHPPSGSAARSTWQYYDICSAFLDKVVMQRKYVDIVDGI